jgi:hypothetical protein
MSAHTKIKSKEMVHKDSPYPDGSTRCIGQHLSFMVSSQLGENYYYGVHKKDDIHQYVARFFYRILKYSKVGGL